MITIYHNPRCSKSREALALVQRLSASKGIPLQVIDYLNTPPDKRQLQLLLSQLGCTAREVVRSNEAEYAALELEKAEPEAILEALVTHPGLLQRPIVCYRDRAVIARPPEHLHSLFDAHKAI